MTVFRSVVLTLSLTVASGLLASDWPQWLGPNRDSVWPETGIVESIPEGGLKIKWRAPVGLGYAGPAVAGGKVYVMDFQKRSGTVKNNPGGRTLLEGEERIICLEAANGKPVWEHAYPQGYNLSYASGPRCTPTVADGHVYALGAEGRLSCLNAGSGKLVWESDLKKTYRIRTQIWGHAAHPLVDDKHVYCLVGGEGSAVVAFDRKNGREQWRALSGTDPGYAPPVMVEGAGRTQLIIWLPDALYSLNPENGKTLWSVPLKPAYDLPCSTPRQQGDLIYASGIGNVSALIRLDSSKPGASIVWRGKPKQAVYCSNSTPFIEGEVLFGADIESSALVGVDLKSGERLWSTLQPTMGEGKRGRHGTAFLVKNADRYFIFSETGHLILAKLSRDGYKELGRQKILDTTNEAFGRPVVWSHPAFADKACFARNDRELVCVDLAK